MAAYEPKTGRSKFTNERRSRIVAALQFGASMETAAALARITEVTLYRWLRRGEDANEETAYGKFYLDVQEARASYRERALQTVNAAIEDDPMLAFKVLERREPGFAPPNVRVPVPSGPVVIQLTFSGGGALPGSGDTVEGEFIEDGEPAQLPSHA